MLTIIIVIIIEPPSKPCIETWTVRKTLIATRKCMHTVLANVRIECRLKRAENTVTLFHDLFYGKTIGSNFETKKRCRYFECVSSNLSGFQFLDVIFLCRHEIFRLRSNSFGFNIVLFKYLFCNWNELYRSRCFRRS